MIRAAILGASGYGGGELIRILLGHPHVDAVQGASRSQAGRPFHAAHPNLRGLSDEPFVASIAWPWLADSPHPVLFSAMPHGELARQYSDLSAAWRSAGLEDRLVLIDLSSDFRIGDPDLYRRYYGGAHPLPELLPEWTYGLPEWNAAEVKGAARIANPGCFAAALQLGLLPLEHLPIEGSIFATGATGSSGSGMNPSDTTHHPTRSNDFRAYKVLTHQHVAEVEQLMGHWEAEFGFSFVPHSAPIVRGIFVTLQFPLQTDVDVAGAFRDHYAAEPFVRLVEGSPRVAAVAGSNFAEIGVAQRDGVGAVMVALDNLLKGMAGNAVQNMNLALGLEETSGLKFVGGFPY